MMFSVELAPSARAMPLANCRPKQQRISKFMEVLLAVCTLLLEKPAKNKQVCTGLFNCSFVSLACVDYVIMCNFCSSFRAQGHLLFRTAIVIRIGFLSSFSRQHSAAVCSRL